MYLTTYYYSNINSYNETNMAASPTRKWSLHTTYTGVVGIHSEVDLGAAARNSLANRRSSDHMMTEEVLMRKQMQSLSLSQRTMEKSMLAYSQKMRDLKEQKTKARNTVEKKDTRRNAPRLIKDVRCLENVFRKSNATQRNGVMPPITCINNEGPITETEFNSPIKPSTTRADCGDVLGRVSIDSGISTDTPSEYSDIMSDAYCSDPESPGRLSSASSVFGSKSDRSSIISTATKRSDDSTAGERAALRRRLRRRRLGADVRPELPTVVDIERQDTTEDKLSEQSTDLFIKNNVSISAFPAFGDDTLVPSSKDPYSSDDDDNRAKSVVSEPLLGASCWALKPASPRRQTAKLDTKPKVIKSPSVTSIRSRKPKPKPSKPFHHIFRYSDLFQVEPNSADNVDNSSQKQRRTSFPKAKSEGSNSSDLRPVQFLKSINESPEPQFSSSMPTERCLSAPLSIAKIVGSAKDVRNSNLKSVLRKNNNGLFERKTVKFSLPDIFH